MSKTEWRQEIDSLISIVEGLTSFSPGVGDSGSVLEQAIGAQLPGQIKYIFERVREFDLDGWHFLNPPHSLSAYREMNDISENYNLNECALDAEFVFGTVKPMYWNSLWVPIFSREHTLLCADLDPGEGGCIGQIVWLQDDGNERHCVASSFASFSALIAGLEKSGHLAREEVGGRIEISARNGFEMFDW